MTDHQYKSKRFFTNSNFVPDIRYQIILQLQTIYLRDKIEKDRVIRYLI